MSVSFRRQREYPNLTMSEALTAIDFVDGANGWITGSNGLLLRTVDGGTHWSSVSAGTRMSLMSVEFVDAAHGWMVGYADGGACAILATTDGGATWTSQWSGSMTWLQSITFVDSDHGWAVGSDLQSGRALILATTDGGTTWQPQTVNAEHGLDSVTFVDGDRGWAVGLQGTIVATVNGGQSWEAQHASTTDSLASVTFANPMCGWAVGSNGTIAATTDGGAHWTIQVSGVATGLDSVAFVDARRGWAMGDGASGVTVLLATSDGGFTWVPQGTGIGGGITWGCFVDANHGWVLAGDRVFGYTDPPTTTLHTDPEAGGLTQWFRAAPVVVSFDATREPEALEVAATYFRYDGGETTTYSAPVLVSTPGSHTFQYWSTNAAGEAESTNTAAVGIDATPPTASLDATGSYSGSATIRVSAFDAVSGLDYVEMALDQDASWTRTGEVSTDSIGSHTVYARAHDIAGNVREVSATFVVLVPLDMRAPETTTNAPVATFYPGTATIHLVAEDTGGSGVAHTYYTLNSGARVEATTVTASVAPGAIETAYTLRFWSVDGAGNPETTHTVKFTVITPPSGKGTPSIPGPIATLRHGRSFTAFGYLIKHTGGTSPVTLQFYRYQSGHWVLRKSTSAKASTVLTFFRYSDSTSVPYSGKWRVRARHKVGSKYLYSGYRTFSAS